MPPIIINPFVTNSISDQIFNVPVIIDINLSNSSTTGFMTHQLTKPLIVFKNCIFNDKLSIQNGGNLIGNLRIYFQSCYITDFEPSTLDYEDISFEFFSCIVSYFRYYNEKNIISRLYINNSLGCFFANNIKFIAVSFTKENIFPKYWKYIIDNTEIKDIFKLPTFFHFQGYESLNIYSNLFDFEKTKREKLKQGFYLSKFNNSRDTKLRYLPSENELSKLIIKVILHFNSEQLIKRNSIYGINLESLKLEGESNGNVEVESSKINNIYIHNFHPLKTFTLYQIEPNTGKGKFEINKSKLENTWFDNVQLNKYDIVSIFRSSVSNINFTSTTFPNLNTNFETFKALKNIHYKDVLENFYYKDQYETFLQLKSALSRNDNHYEAQKLKSIAYNSLSKVKGVDFWDKVILWLNKHSNFHGVKPFRALKWIFALSITFYLLYLNSLGLLFGKSLNWNLVANYFSFLDLTHKSNFLVEKSNLSNFAIVIDFANKIVIGYLIYQFITSFRKFGK